MSNSLDEVFVVGGSLIVGIAMPLTALQIIWVNLFTGSLPALAFAYDDDFDHQMYKHRTLKIYIYSRGKYTDVRYRGDVFIATVLHVLWID
jgi:magnesium-transporting ATPase (P-type)